MTLILHRFLATTATTAEAWGGTCTFFFAGEVFYSTPTTLVGAGNLNQDPLFVDPPSGDYRLSSNSPCIDTGDPGDSAPGKDISGSPRHLDGSLDRNRQVDMGAFEFDHVHLEVSGTPSPGSTVTLSATGTVGLQSWLFAGLGEQELDFGVFGNLFVDLSLPWLLVRCGPLPCGLSGPVPLDIPAGTELVLQGLALSGNAGNLSNCHKLIVIP